MSPYAGNNFVSDLVLMAQAMEKLPQVQEQLNDSQTEVSEWKSRYDLQALDLEQARQNNAALEQRLHDAEVAKDAAETMFLEADDRTSRALDFIKATFGNAGTLIQALEPPRAEPPKVEQTVETGPVTEREYAAYTQAQPEPIVSEVKPIEPEVVHIVDEASGYAKPYPVTQGQSKADPTPNVVGDGPASTVTHTEPAGPVYENINTEPSPGPYSGKRYHDLPTYVPLDGWLEF